MVYATAILLALMWFLQAKPNATELEKARNDASVLAKKHQQDAIRLNDLAGRIKTESDADALVNSVAEMFADSLPPAWATRDLRQRIAKMELETVTDRSKLIPEQRLANLWNEYVSDIQAGNEAIVSVPELHSLRDGQYSSAKLMWSRGWNQSVWTMPNVFAVDSDGKVAAGCRTLEALRVFYDLDNNFASLRAARKALKEGRVFSDELERMNRQQLNYKTELRAIAEVGVNDNPVRDAEYRYVREHGSLAMDALLKHLADEFLVQ
jgi:hypothetical protein